MKHPIEPGTLVQHVLSRQKMLVLSQDGCGQTLTPMTWVRLEDDRGQLVDRWFQTSELEPSSED